MEKGCLLAGPPSRPLRGTTRHSGVRSVQQRTSLRPQVMTGSEKFPPPSDAAPAATPGHGAPPRARAACCERATASRHTPRPTRRPAAAPGLCPDRPGLSARPCGVRPPHLLRRAGRAADAVDARLRSALCPASPALALASTSCSARDAPCVVSAPYGSLRSRPNASCQTCSRRPPTLLRPVPSEVFGDGLLIAPPTRRPWGEGVARLAAACPAQRRLLTSLSD